MDKIKEALIRSDKYKKMMSELEELIFTEDREDS